jgi:hypothetical protein
MDLVDIHFGFMYVGIGVQVGFQDGVMIATLVMRKHNA